MYRCRNRYRDENVAASKTAPVPLDYDCTFAETRDRMALESSTLGDSQSPMATPTLVFVRLRRAHCRADSCKGLRLLCSRGRCSRQEKRASRRQRRWLQFEMAAGAALLACTRTRTVFDLHASPGRSDGQLHRDQCFRKARDDALQARTRLRGHSDHHEDAADPLELKRGVGESQSAGASAHSKNASSLVSECPFTRQTRAWLPKRLPAPFFFRLSSAHHARAG